MVTLDVAVTWIDPETQEFRSEPASFVRSSANALREFAPGATFYARGLEILIDAVDLGPDDSAIQSMAFCPACGFALDLSALGPGGTVPSLCPRCGGAGFSGTEHRLDVVELSRVSAQLRRDEAAISDRNDERKRERYAIAVAADIDPAYVAKQWYVNDYDFGTKYLRRMVIRWVNVGRAGAHGASRQIAGNTGPAPLFRVCEGCGVLDKNSGANRPDEHRAWCRYRKADDEHVRNIALTRTLTTQGAVIRLPQSVTLGDQFAIPSLAAALLLGLHEQIGGSPDHIDIAAISEPVAGHDGATSEALLLHDVVPGGTGYLAELADPLSRPLPIAPVAAASPQSPATSPPAHRPPPVGADAGGAAAAAALQLAAPVSRWRPPGPPPAPPSSVTSPQATSPPRPAAQRGAARRPFGRRRAPAPPPSSCFSRSRAPSCRVPALGARPPPAHARMWDLLHRAWERVRDCPCQHEQRLACHRCLVPFAPAGGLSRVSRSAAERHLRAILTSGTPDAEPAEAMSWSLTAHEPALPSPESHLEQSFRKVFTERVTALGATVKETPGPQGNRLSITFPGATRQWTLEPQVQMGEQQARLRAPLQPGQPAGGGHLHRRLAVPRQPRPQPDRRRRAQAAGAARQRRHRPRDHGAGRGARAERNLRDAAWLRERRDRRPDEFQRHVPAAERGGHPARPGRLPALLDPEPRRRRAPGAGEPPALHVRPGRPGTSPMDPTADLAREAALRLLDPDRVTPAGDAATAAWWWSAGSVGCLTRTSGDN